MLYQVWYQVERTWGHGFSTEGVDPHNLAATHRCVGWIDAHDCEDVFARLNLEAHGPLVDTIRRLCQARLLTHQSMSVGDALVDQEGIVHLCEVAGFSEHEPRGGSRPNGLRVW